VLFLLPPPRLCFHRRYLICLLSELAYEKLFNGFSQNSVQKVHSTRASTEEPILHFGGKSASRYVKVSVMVLYGIAILRKGGLCVIRRKQICLTVTVFATSLVLAEVCALLSAILLLYAVDYFLKIWCVSKIQNIAYTRTLHNY